MEVIDYLAIHLQIMMRQYDWLMSRILQVVSQHVQGL